jgi:two-component system CheB/CheR fusion protein
LPGLIEDIREVFENGSAQEREVYHPGADAHFMLRVAPYRDGDLRIEGVVLSFIEISSLVQARQHQQTLIAELNHRVKNMLMVAIGIAQQTHKSAATPAAFLEAFVGRLQAMARSYELVSQENWTESSLRTLVETELAPFGLERLTIEGPAINLKPKSALSLGMVLHELATNAGKYGALTEPNGRVSIQWVRALGKRGEDLAFQWTEIGGPPVAPSAKRGFGLKLIDKETSYNLGGRAEIEFRPAGLAAKIDFPLDTA